MRSLIVCLALFASACGAPAQSQTQPAQSTPPPAKGAVAPAAIEIANAWAAPTPGGVDVSAGYLTITNRAGAADALLGASSPRAARVEIHEMTMDGAVMRMRQIESLPAPVGETVTLGPGSLHLMFLGVARPFTAGEEIPVRLRFEHAGEVDVTLLVRAQGARHGH